MSKCAIQFLETQLSDANLPEGLTFSNQEDKQSETDMEALRLFLLDFSDKGGPSVEGQMVSADDAC